MTRTPLTGHEGHPAVVVSSTQIRCTPCNWLIDWGRSKSEPADRPTPIPPRYVRPTGVVTPPSSVPEWEQVARKRWPRKGPKP